MEKKLKMINFDQINELVNSIISRLLEIFREI